jgi:DhnA family fructose-bisphosphate aldolase class Ia
MTITDRDLLRLTQTRVDDPTKIERALEKRVRRPNLTKDGRLFLVAADHPARGALTAMGNPSAMGNRFDLLRRLAAALEVEGVDGVLASADIIEDLALLGVLDDRVVIGTTNRGGIVGADWELDDRMTAYDAEHIDRRGLDGGKMLLRIALDDSGTAATIEACAKLVTDLADRKLMAMIEPLPYERHPEGGVRLIRDQAQLLAAIAIASGLGSTSAYSWLKVPAWSQMAEIAAVTTLPLLILGGSAGPDLAATLETWQVALAQPTVRGLVVGRALLYPTSGDVHSAVSAAAKLVRP